ncbi:MAG: hydroxyisourate hydrolase [Deltaproteobacteria bacterium]|nr:hydroxyisourate hydrolase [Deltaproteobacteria bacterium]
MSTISTHVLDTARGRPAAGMVIQLDRLGAAATHVNDGVTDRDGRIGDLGVDVVPGTYKVTFGTGDYLSRHGVTEAFYPVVEIVFHIYEDDEHYHIPLLLSPYGYSTYRGS